MKTALKSLGRGAIVKTSSFTQTASGSFQVVVFDTITQDQFSTLTGTRINIPKEGWYLFTGNGTWGNNSSNARAIAIVINATITIGIISLGANDGSVVPDMNCTGAYYCYPGDYVELFAFQNSGGSLAITNVTLQALQLPKRGRGCRLAQSGNFSVSNNSEGTLDYNSITKDDFGTADLTKTKITIPKEGWYLFFLSGNWASNTTGERYGALKLNGSIYTGTHGSGVNQGNSNPNQNITSAYYCRAGDYMEVVVFQASGGSLNFGGYALTAIQIG